MKNKTLVIVGGLAVTAALVGGGTFAAWSDFDETPASAGAGILKLNVSSTSSGGTAQSLGFGNLAPGENRIHEFFVASSDAESVPNGTLLIDFTDLVDIEGNGPGNPTGVGNNCTTNSEREAEGGDCGGVGEFSAQAVMTVHKAAPVSGGCAGAAYGSDATRVYPSFAGSGNPQAVNTLAAHVAAPQQVVDSDVAPGEGVCIQIRLGMPLLENGSADGTDDDSFSWGTTLFDSTNASQGDSSEFTVRFDLVQNT